MKNIVLPLCAALASMAGPIPTATAHTCVELSGVVNTTVNAPCVDNTQHECRRVTQSDVGQTAFVCVPNETHTKTAR